MGRGELSRIVFGLLMLYAFAVPWEYSLELGEPFGNVARVLGLALLPAVVLLVLARGRVREPGTVQWLVMGLFLYFACSYFWTVDAEMTLGKVRAYAQVMMVVWLAWEVVETPPELRALVRATVAGCSVLAALTLLDFAGVKSVGGLVAAEQVRFVADGQDPNDVARFLDMGFPLAAWLFATERDWWVRLGAILYLPVGLMAVLLTASRGGASGAVVALLGSVGLLVAWRARLALAMLAGLLIAGVGLGLAVPAETLDRLATIPAQIGSGDLNDRLQIWIAGWRAFAEAPWWGTGAGTFTTAAGLAPGDTAHNTLIAVLVNGGLVGTAVFVAIISGGAWAVWRTRGLLRIALGTALMVWALTSMVGSVEENRMTWLLFALIALAERPRTADRDQFLVRLDWREGFYLRPIHE